MRFKRLSTVELRLLCFTAFDSFVRMCLYACCDFLRVSITLLFLVLERMKSCCFGLFVVLERIVCVCCFHLYRLFFFSLLLEQH